MEDRCILVGVKTPKTKRKQYQHPLDELERLAETAGIQTIGKLVQRLPKFHPKTYVGKGKAEELQLAISELEANILVFDDDLTPAQGRNIGEVFKIKSLDRTELILDIFASHAQTREAKLQVELAQLEYSLPRLKRLWDHLDRYKGGVGTRGPGEKQLETDRRLVKKRISDLKRKLQDIQDRKMREVNSRREQFFTVGLVGYTNAGKSTLMNHLTEAGTLVEDKLFATLDTKTRNWEITRGREVLLSDTVGFIEKLPHHLVASFRATLEEAAQADLLLHVVDVSYPDAEINIKVVREVLASMDLDKKPTLLVFNKMDAVEDPLDLQHFQEKYSDSVFISAKLGKNIDVLKEKVLEFVDASSIDLQVHLPISNGRVISWIEKNTMVLKHEITDNQVKYLLRLLKPQASWLQKQGNLEVVTV